MHKRIKYRDVKRMIEYNNIKIINATEEKVYDGMFFFGLTLGMDWYL